MKCPACGKPLTRRKRSLVGNSPSYTCAGDHLAVERRVKGRKAPVVVLLGGAKPLLCGPVPR